MTDEPPGREASDADIHSYLSTACWHRVCSRCREECKFCGRNCTCVCHGARADYDDADLRASLVAALASTLTATRTVLAGSAACRGLAANRGPGEEFEHDGERWTRFTAAADESTAFTVHYGFGGDGLFVTAAVGQLVDAVLEALRSRPARG